MQSTTEDVQLEPKPRPTSHEELAPTTMVDTEQTIHVEPIASEPPQPSATPIPNPTPT